MRCRVQILFMAAFFVFAGVTIAGNGAMAQSGTPPLPDLTLHSFCPQSGCAGGAVPKAGLVMDAAGNLYGTTFNGGSQSFGTVFKLAPTGAGWTETVLYNFCQQASCADGYHPQGSLIMDGAGNLYGTADGGGKAWRGGQAGVVFKLAPPGG